MGINTLSTVYLKSYDLPFSLRDDLISSMKRLKGERVDIFLGNHMQHNHTLEKAKRLETGDKYAFVDPCEWATYCEWVIENCKNIEK